MNNKRTFVVWSFVLIFLSMAIFMVAADEPVGQVVYLEGIVDLHRDGAILELFDSDVGLEIYNQDLIETGDDGRLEIEMIAYTNPGTMIKVSESTAFYIDFSRRSGEVQLDVPLLAGALAFKVKKLVGSESLNVNTPSAVASVRGTDFEVVTAPEGSILVLCEEGRVVCEDDRKNRQYAQAGRVVEKRSGENVRAQVIDPGDEQLYRAFWSNQREQVFRAGAPTFVKAYAIQYLNSLPRFAEAYQKSVAHAETLKRYSHAEGGSNSDLLLIYNEISKDLIPARGIFNLFEQIFYSVKTLQGYHAQGIGQVQISEDLNSREFFNGFTAYEPVLKSQLAEMHYMYKLFTQLASVASPAGGSLMEDIFSGSNPLGASPPSSTFPGSSF